MNVKAVSRNVGYALLVSSLFMLLSVGVSLLNGGDSALYGLLISFLLTFSVGIFPFIFVRGTEPITLKDGYLIIVLSWLLSFVFGMLPYIMWGGPFTLANAWFESVSGFTTTGATVLQDIEALPPSLLFWRAATHFIGGLGIVVFMLLIIPGASPIRLRLTNMELSSLSKSGYATRSNRTVYVFTYVYLAICMLAFIAYSLAGMDSLDAICHAFSVCATGGFSTRNLSIAAYGSPLIEGITFFFMLLASLHFGLLFLAVVNRSLKPLKNPVLRFYVITLAVFSVLMAMSLRFSGQVEGFGKALWYGAFQTVSVASTTGFAVADNASWPLSTMVLMMFMAVMCGCAGSTTGGVKADRVYVLIKSIGRQIVKILHPSSVDEVRIGKRVLRDEEVAPHILYIALYCLLLAISVCISLVLGLDPTSSFAASVSSLGNVGPAMGDLGNLGNFDSLAKGVKFLFTMDMFLGRIEIYPVLAVVAMVVEHRRK